MTCNLLAIKLGYFAGKLGVNLFTLTTGYFQVSGRFKWRKLFSLLAQILFYSLLTHSIGLFVGAVSLSSPKDILRLLFPTIYRQYWFATAYAIVYLFSPYANRLIASMDEKTFRRLLITALMLYSVIPTVFGLTTGNTESWLYYNEMIWLFIMYFMGAYIRLYSLPLLKSMRRALTCALGAFALATLSIVVIYASSAMFGTPSALTYFAPQNTVLTVILSVGTFCVFLQLKTPDTQWINRVASTTFGIYLLHDSNALRSWIWKTRLRFPEKINSPTLIPQILLVCACIFLIGMLVDFARQSLERVTLKKWLSSERFQRFEERFDVNNVKKET